MTAAGLSARLRALPLRAKLVLAAAALLAGAALAWAGAATHDTRVALFATPLHPEQLAEVQQRLAAWNVAFGAGPDNVRVERKRRGDLLLRLGLAGIPHPHLAGSDESLARVGALTPQSVLEVQTRDALAADLALALRGLDGVADARVVIAPSSAGGYADERARDASASVRVNLQPGARLSAPAVAGIRAFVAGGVPGLDPERVIVLDDRGLAPAAPDGTDAAGVQSALQSALDGAFGSGATIVRVRRETLGESRDVHLVRRAALDAALSRSTNDERYASSVKKYSKTSASEDRGSDLREERRVAAPDATARLGVAVFADAARGLDLAKLRAFAAAAAGVRTERGDTLTVQAVAFAGSGRVPVAPPAFWTALGSLLPQALAAAALVAGIAFGAKPAAAFATRALEIAAARGAVAEAAGLPPGRVRGALVNEPPHVAAAIISALPAATAAAVLELYPSEERSAIVRRLARGTAPSLLPDAHELLRGG